MSVPRKDLVKSIARRSLAAITDEHKSTQTCSCCGSRLCDPDLRLLDANGTPQGDHREFNKKQKTRIRRCKSEACSVPVCIQSNDGVSNLQLVWQKHWNRDVNAAINIRKTDEEWLHSRHSRSRPVHLRRTIADICVNQREQPTGGITLAIKEKTLNATVVMVKNAFKTNRDGAVVESWHEPQPEPPAKTMGTTSGNILALGPDVNELQIRECVPGSVAVAKCQSGWHNGEDGSCNKVADSMNSSDIGYNKYFHLKCTEVRERQSNLVNRLAANIAYS